MTNTNDFRPMPLKIQWIKYFTNLSSDIRQDTLRMVLVFLLAFDIYLSITPKVYHIIS